MDIEDAILEPSEPRTRSEVHSRFIKKKAPLDNCLPVGDNIPGKDVAFIIIIYYNNFIINCLILVCRF